MLILEINEKCPHSENCKFNLNSSCNGSSSNRPNKFICEYADRSIVYNEGTIRNCLDITGKMKVIMEGGI